jgi:polar amino acid transport system substrate-binding protein
MRAGRWRRGSFLGLLLAVALVAAGCGGGDDDKSSGAQSGGTKLEGLITPGTLTVATELPAPPFWIGDDYDHITGGFEVDFAKELAKRVGLANVKFVEMPFSGLVAGQQCPCDINFSQVTITPDRDKVVDFTEPYFDANQGVLAKKGITVANLDDAKKVRWGVQLNTTANSYLADKIKPATEPRVFDRTTDAFAALNAGQIDAVMLDTPKADGFRDQLFKKYFADQAAVPEIPV